MAKSDYEKRQKAKAQRQENELLRLYGYTWHKYEPDEERIDFDNARAHWMLLDKDGNSISKATALEAIAKVKAGKVAARKAAEAQRKTAYAAQQVQQTVPLVEQIAKIRAEIEALNSSKFFSNPARVNELEWLLFQMVN